MLIGYSAICDDFDMHSDWSIQLAGHITSNILPLCDQNSSTRQIERFYEASCSGTGYEIVEMNGGAGKIDEMLREKVYL